MAGIYLPLDAERLLQMSGELRLLAEALAPFDGPAPLVCARTVRTMIRLRRLRRQIFEGNLFLDPAWDMMLDLLAARLETKRVSVSSLCLASGAPPTTALRWIRALEGRGVLVRSADPKDGRRVYVSLSEDAASKMIEFLTLVVAGPITLV